MSRNAMVLLFTLAAVTAQPRAQLVDGFYTDARGKTVIAADQWGLAAIGLDEKAHGRLLADASFAPVVVAVIDTGLDFRHPDMVDENLWLNIEERINGIDDDGNGYIDDVRGWDFIDDDNDPSDPVGHGTHVAGVIAATAGNGAGIRGINSRVQVMPLRALNSGGSGLSTRVAAAIYYAVANGARVINLSMAVADVSSHEQKAISYAQGQGVLVVAAAGNERAEVAAYTPASIDGVLTVSAVDRDLTPAWFANYGPAIDIAAPGVDIVSLRASQTDMNITLGADGAAALVNLRGPDDEYYSASGTSFAAPFVSGAASLLFSSRPTLTGEQVRRMLVHSTRDIDQPGRDQATGYGLLQVPAALAADPDFYLSCAISGIEVASSDGATVVRVSGSATANALTSVTLELGAGETPKKFRRVGKPTNRAVADGVIGDIPASMFSGNTTWTLQLLVTHRNKRVQACRYLVNLG